MSEFCNTEVDGHLLTVTINRPDVMNAIHPELNQELHDAFEEFDRDPALWVAIITATGDRAFCAGLDLKYLANSGERVQMPPSGFAGLTERYNCTKPIIAAVNGVAFGGGFEAALACDLIIASENASFALPEPRVGVAALAGGMHQLPRQIGLKQAMGMLLSGRRVGAEEGMRLGFVNEVVPLEDLEKTARRWADQIGECAPLSVRATKQCVLRGLHYPSVEEAMDARYDALEEMIASEDFVEGP
ncbi:MAG: enoyl-CoA hydratase/carnithine racemase, partial [Candidatus Paceibacteria bacterium]